MSDHISREDALALVKAHNKEPFHIQHALTVEGVMKYFARELGYADQEERNTGASSDCCTILILRNIRRSTASRRRRSCGKLE